MIQLCTAAALRACGLYRSHKGKTRLESQGLNVHTLLSPDYRKWRRGASVSHRKRACRAPVVFTFSRTGVPLPVLPSKFLTAIHMNDVSRIGARKKDCTRTNSHRSSSSCLSSELQSPPFVSLKNMRISSRKSPFGS